MAIINPKPQSFKELIQDRFYRVPLYQRPYNWDIDKVSELWDDMLKNDSGYFLGFMLFKPEDGDDPHPVEFEVVDGQQRLATLLLLLRAAVETFAKAGVRNIADEFQRDYIAQRPAGVDKSRLTLVLSKRDKDKFESILLGEPFSSGKYLSSWKNLDKAHQFLCGKFDKLHEKKGKDGLVKFINEKVLRLSFLGVILGTDSDVYQFFETLNDRGMDLSIADLVKNRVCGKAVLQGISVEDSAFTIDSISETLSPGKFKAFLLHYCWANVKGEPTPRKKLMDWYGQQISQVKNIKNFLMHLEKYALTYYVNFVQPNKCTDSNKREAFIYLDALGATRCYPLLLRGEDSLKKKGFIELCKALEILTFRHSTILKRDAKVLEGVFNDLIKDITKGKSITDIVGVLRKQPAMKDDNQFKLAFAEFIPANHKLARYTLLKIEEFIQKKNQAPLDWNRLTLEHILAEKLNWRGRDEYLERLGNLTLLSFPMNDKASNKPFNRKREEDYKKEQRIQITKDLVSYPKFTQSQIKSRQKELAKIAPKIWKF